MFRYIDLRLLAFCFLAATATVSAADEETAAPDEVEETEEIESDLYNKKDNRRWKCLSKLNPQMQG